MDWVLLLANPILEGALLLLLILIVDKEVTSLGELAQRPAVLLGEDAEVMLVANVVLQREPVVSLSCPVAVFALLA